MRASRLFVLAASAFAATQLYAAPLESAISRRVETHILTARYGFAQVKPENRAILRQSIQQYVGIFGADVIRSLNHCLTTAIQSEDPALGKVCADYLLQTLRAHKMWNRLVSELEYLQDVESKLPSLRTGLRHATADLAAYRKLSHLDTQLSGAPQWIRQIPFRTYRYRFHNQKIVATEDVQASNIVNVEINSHAVSAQVDTESPYTIFSDTTARRIGIERVARTENTRAAFGGPGVSSWISKISRSNFGGIKVRNMQVVEVKSWFDNAVGNLIGYDFLERVGGFEVKDGRFAFQRPSKYAYPVSIPYRYYRGQIVTQLSGVTGGKDYLVCIDTGADKSFATATFGERFPDKVKADAKVVSLNTVAGTFNQKVAGRTQLALDMGGDALKLTNLPVWETGTFETDLCDITLGTDVLLSRNHFGIDTVAKRVYLDVANTPIVPSAAGDIVTKDLTPSGRSRATIH